MFALRAMSHKSVRLGTTLNRLGNVSSRTSKHNIVLSTMRYRDEGYLRCCNACKIDPGFAQEINPPGSSQAPNCTVFFILEVGHSNMQILATIGSIFGAIQHI